MAGSRSAGPLLAAVVLLVGTNVVTNVVAPDRYLVWTTLAVLGLVLLAHFDGLRRAEWGLGPITSRAAAATVLLAASTAALMVVASQLPAAAPAFSDERVAGMSAGQVAFAALVRAPLGTALLEEVAFRGIGLAMLAQRLGTSRAVALSSTAFGLWHVVAASALAGDNAALASGTPMLVAALGVAASAFAGVFLCWLRLRFDHLVVPYAVHATANATAYLLAWLAMRP